MIAMNNAIMSPTVHSHDCAGSYSARKHLHVSLVDHFNLPKGRGNPATFLGQL